MRDFSSTLLEPPLEQRQVILDYSEYTGESVFSIVEKINGFHALTQTDFNTNVAQAGSKWEGQKRFYEQSQNYIYDLLGGNGCAEGVANKLNKFIPDIMRNVRFHVGTTFAEFGGGIGLMCEMIHEWTDLHVTYIDIQSLTTDFARWRYAKYGLTDIEMLIIPQEDFQIDRQFSIVFTDAVWEHLDPTRQIRYARKLANMVEQNGILIFIVDLQGESLHMPMHYDVNIYKVFDQFRKNKLVPIFVESPGRFATVWRRVYI